MATAQGCARKMMYWFAAEAGWVAFAGGWMGASYWEVWAATPAAASAPASIRPGMATEERMAGSFP